MQAIYGAGICGGIVFGRLRYYRRPGIGVTRAEAADTDAELHRYEAAKRYAAAQLDTLYRTSARSIGGENARLFEIHRMMLDDPDLVEAITARITNDRCNAEYAVEQAGLSLARSFAALEDGYMKARAADIRDVTRRLVRILQGGGEHALSFGEPVVLAAEDLLPSETAVLDKKTILAIVTSGGAPNSHTAIFARSMSIPAVIGLGEALNGALDGERVAVDAARGILYVSPDAETITALESNRKREATERTTLESWRGKRSVTRNGRPVMLYANAGGPADLDAALANDAEGVGLLRSEFLYLGRDSFPDEETQFQAYREAAGKMRGKRVIIRTLDIGADKQVPYFGLPPEENPALGMRAIRICLTRPGIFKTQLRALYRASAFGRIAIMFPMISAVGEVERAKAICAEVMEELARERIPFRRDVELGIMVETPAAAVLSDRLAPLVDFFSIGTNDLAQYTFAMDRQSPALSKYYDGENEALLRLMRMTVENAHKAGIWCGVCGELAADRSLTGRLLEMGVDELSVSASQILELRRKIASIDA